MYVAADGLEHFTGLWRPYRNHVCMLPETAMAWMMTRMGFTWLPSHSGCLTRLNVPTAVNHPPSRIYLMLLLCALHHADTDPPSWCMTAVEVAVPGCAQSCEEMHACDHVYTHSSCWLEMCYFVLVDTRPSGSVLLGTMICSCMYA